VLFARKRFVARRGKKGRVTLTFLNSQKRVCGTLTKEGGVPYFRSDDGTVEGHIFRFSDVGDFFIPKERTQSANRS